MLLVHSVNECWFGGRNVLEPMVQGQELRQILTMDRSVHLPPDLRGSNTSNLRDRGLDRMAAFPQFVGLATVGNTKRSRNDRHNDADVHSLHLWLASRGRSDRRRTNDAADHGGHASARQRDPIFSWPFHLHASCCDRSIGQVGDNGSPFCCVRCGTPWYLLPCCLSFSDRLRRTASDSRSAFSRASATKDARSSRASTATGLVAQTPLMNRIGSFQRRTGSLSIAASPRHSWR